MFALQFMARVFCMAAAAWTAGALYYDAGQRTWRGRLLVATWLAALILLFNAVRPVWLALAIFCGAFGLILWWWLGQKPSHDRQWDENFAKLPRLGIDGDTLTVSNVRNTDYRSLEDYDCHHETRTYSMSGLHAVDILILYWGSKWMCHPMAIFDFGNQQHLCFSIEVRYRRGDEYDFFRGLYRQNELFYLVSDERDAILRRSKFSAGHECYLYRLQTAPETVRLLFEEYMEATNGIAEQPRWYNMLTSNCTTSIYWQRKGQVSWDWRLLFNGSLDKMLYEWKRLYQGLEFSELRKRSLINDVANAASKENFGREIRAGLPGFENS